MVRVRPPLRLDGPRIVVAPGVYDAFTARLVAEAGFDAAYLTGAGVNYSQIGTPDFGLATLTEMADTLRRITGTFTGPVIADFDNGYGGVLNVRRAVGMYQNAGASAFHIEDQDYPKRCGQLDGVTVLPVEEMVGKVRAAVDARAGDGPLVIARTDAFRSEGLEGVIARGRRYMAAGADGFFPECAGMTDEDLKIIGQEVDAPLVIAMVEGASGPFLSAAELEAIGFNCVLFPNALLRSFGAIGKRLLATLAADGTTAAMMPEMLSFGNLMGLLGYRALREWEQQWSTGTTA